MIKYEKEDLEIQQIFDKRKRDAQITQHVGYVLMDSEAEDYARYRSGKQRVQTLIAVAMILLTLAVTLATVIG